MVTDTGAKNIRMEEEEEFSFDVPLFFPSITRGKAREQPNVESNPEPKRAALPLVLAHHTHYLLGHKPSIYLSPRSFICQKTCGYILYVLAPSAQFAKGYKLCFAGEGGNLVGGQILNICSPLAG